MCPGADSCEATFIPKTRSPQSSAQGQGVGDGPRARCCPRCSVSAALGAALLGAALLTAGAGELGAARAEGRALCPVPPLTGLPSCATLGGDRASPGSSSVNYEGDTGTFFAGYACGRPKYPIAF